MPGIFTKGISNEVHFTRLREGLMGSPLGPAATAFPVDLRGGILPALTPHDQHVCHRGP